MRMVDYYMVAYMTGAASISIRYDQTNSVCAWMSISMGRILFVGGIAITKIPSPGTYSAIAGGLVCKTNGLLVWINLMEDKYCMTDTGRWMMHNNMLTYMTTADTIFICDCQTNRISPRIRISMNRILFRGGGTIAKVPAPETDRAITGGLVRKTKIWLIRVCLVKNKSSMTHTGGRMMNHNLMTYVTGATMVICDVQADSISALICIYMGRVLFSGGSTITKIPGPRGNCPIAG